MKPHHLSLTLFCLLLAACSGPPPTDVTEARRNVENPEISPVAFRAMDAFFPTATITKDPRLSKLPIAPSPSLSLDTQIDLGDGPTTLDEALRESHTNALLILKNGQVVFETYFNESNENSRFIGWSMSKSILSLLVGIALEDGSINSLDDSAQTYWTALAETPFAKVSIRHLLQMKDGVDYKERSLLGTADISVLTEQSLFTGEKRFTDISELDLSQAHSPGETFNYSTLTSCILGRVLEEATGSTLALYTQEKLWKPARMRSNAYWLLDGVPGVGQAFGGGGINATLRDYARIGQLVLQKGQLNGTQIVPAAWIEQSTQHEGTEPVLPRTPRGYGYHWWTFVDNNIVEAVGIHGQFISIDPDTQTVIVKASYWPKRGGGERHNMNLFQAIRAAL